ncbi:tRNA (adenosine(37)-N6)-dimethylallyltransferase MiaA [Halobacteriovorax sp. HLS]|uniref:tRNA (adenosine(37)-N6)-dimethylallyltransferase MiaA n=1 Tax=Halobacteriovorax sp. HLS TaxID=2234000 RepID=UPI000FDC73D2|nr:tRNA (adenosine(37)-N6)-dimethylallyltransferase MiaA [Halobacteriovorax sp. HLS]
MKQNKIFFISGPTATGKTSTSINLCRHLNENNCLSEIVNFDSLVFYKELSIGTAKPTQEEMGNCKHHFVGMNSAKEPINASDFINMADKLLENLTNQGICPIFVGGSAFYLRAFIKGMYESQPISDKVRNDSQKIFEQEGIQFFRDFLKKNDISSYNNLHENDHYRNIRAYEFFIQNNCPISDEKKKHDENSPYDFSINRLKNYSLHHIYLDLDKQEHWNIILNRCHQMVKDGLINEVRDLLTNGFTGNEKPLQSIGYKETIQFLNNEFKDQNEYIERMAISTRQLAKSQRTFFKKVVPKKSYHPILDRSKIIEDAQIFIQS